MYVPKTFLLGNADFVTVTLLLFKQFTSVAVKAGSVNGVNTSNTTVSGEATERTGLVMSATWILTANVEEIFPEPSVTV